MQKLRRVGMGLAMTAGLMLAASACGVDSTAMSVQAGSAVSGVKGAALISQAATSTAALTSGHFSGSGSLSGSSAASASLDGSFDRTAESAQLTVTVDKGAGAGTAFSTVIVDGVVYVETGKLGMLGLETPWLSLDVAKLAADPRLQDLFPQAGGAAPGSSNPDAFLDVLRGVSGEVTAVGPETLRGEPTTHYRAEVIPAKALDDLPADRQEALRKALGDQLDTPIPVDVWIDADGLVRKVSSSQDVGSGATVSGSFEFYDFDVPVTITAPPADQVTPAESLPILKDLLGN